MITIDETLRQKNFDAYEEIYRIRPAIDPEERNKYCAETALDGTPVVYIRSDEDWICTESLYSPLYEALRWTDGQTSGWGNSRTSLAVLGFGSGYRIETLKGTLRPDTDIYVYEPVEGFFAFICGIRDITDIILDDRIRIYLPSLEDGAFLGDLEQTVLSARAELRQIRLPFYSENSFFNSVYNDVLSSILAGANFQRTRGRLSLKNRLYSWVHLHRNALFSDLAVRLPRELPVVVVAGGPSLLKNASGLKALKGRALIISIDRAVHVLHDNGVIPDMLAAADVEKSVSHMKADGLEDVPVICSFQTNREVQEYFDGRLIMIHGWKGEQLLPGLSGRVPMQGILGGNVAGAVLITFMEYGFKNIILVGQDLAMAGEMSHADGSHEGAMLDADEILVEGIDGTPVVSRRDWMSFRDTYEQFIKMYPECRVIDATEGGALIHGSEVMTLEEAADAICIAEYDIQALLRDIPRAQTEEDHRGTLSLLENWRQELLDIASKAEELAELCDQLYRVSRYQDISDLKHQKKIARIDELRAAILSKPIYDLMLDHWIEDMDSIPDRTFVIRNNEEAAPVFEKAMKYYAHLPEDCRSLREAIENSKKCLQTSFYSIK